MERQLVRKNRIPRKRRSVLGEAQSGPSNSVDRTPSDNAKPEHSLLVSTARRIGSVLGKIVARAGHSFNARKPRIELTSKTTVRLAKPPRSGRVPKAQKRACPRFAARAKGRGPILSVDRA